MSSQPSHSFVSVIMPVYNGATTLDRAIRSVQFQTFSNWELVAVDDCSTDDSPAILQRWAEQDSRIRIDRLDENRGVSAARNAAIAMAQGEFVSYLDQDDEYYTDHLAQVWQLRDRGDVLMFGYDFVYEDGPAGGRIPSWDPGQARQHLFANYISTPLGVAHRREWWEKAGGFNEAWCEEDSDLWRRMARAGARYEFMPHTSGLYHVRRDSASRMPHITRRQREAFLANWRAGRPMYDRAPGPSRRKVEKIAFVTPYCVIDPTSEAAIATLDILGLLADLGFSCEVLCGSHAESQEGSHWEDILARRNVLYEIQGLRFDCYAGRLILAAHGKVPVTLFDMNSRGGQWQDERETNAYLATCEWFLKKNRPDVLWTFGSDAVAIRVQQVAKHLDIPVLFALYDLSHRDTQPFKAVDYVITANEFCRQHYWRTLGLFSQKLLPVIDSKRMVAETRQPRFLTFVNHQPHGGALVFARIAERLARRRPDIPVLLVQGPSQTDPLAKMGIEGPLKNLTMAPAPTDPREYLAKTRLLLVPSLEEDLGLAAIEAMVNGIPIVASNRGSLPETVGDAGILLEMPRACSADPHVRPTTEDVEPWAEAILRLWDDEASYTRLSERSRDRSRLWQAEHLGPIYREFFGGLCHQPGAPLLPKQFVEQAS
jgi:glycosyltransferase involved in cell wall biosynthesis